MSTTAPTQPAAKDARPVDVSVTAPWGCTSICKCGIVDGKAKFGHETNHVSSTKCECRRNPSAEAEAANDRKLIYMLADAWEQKRSSTPLELATAFLYLKQNADAKVFPPLRVGWNEQDKTWTRFLQEP
ncbi:hypothetical protein NUW58_g7550 [Xylaria curta]|uniref:Uncharacterized protein n=1 Tax=Xylaria curta TaxID=42375 RepID=A0ACC1NIU9_9PEZI|nr:hypothetical protein NUW58_g7550 [Xylaria curta]